MKWLDNMTDSMSMNLSKLWEILKDRETWYAAVHGVMKSWTRLSDFTFTFHFHALEKEMQPTPVFLPGESQGREPGGLPSMGSKRVGHDWRDLAAAAALREHLRKSKYIAHINPY